MLRLILKNLWARRYRNGWLLAELIVVAIVMWALTDPVAVLTHNRNLPNGFQMDGLYSLSLNAVSKKSSSFNPDEDSQEARVVNVRRIMERLRNHPQVEYATIDLGGYGPFRMSSNNSTYDVDSVGYNFQIFFFEPQSDFFRTFAFDEVDGQTNEQLDAMVFNEGEVCVTTGAFPGKQMRGYRYEDPDDEDRSSWTAKATIGELRMRGGDQPRRVMLSRKKLEDISLPDEACILFRTKPGVSEGQFLHEFRVWGQSNLKAGNLYMRGVQSYYDVLKESDETGVAITYRLCCIMAIFFLISLFLGVAGTFWMQTRSRREEVGVMKSFGGSNGFIIRLLLGEGWVLTTFATFLGCLIYLQYAVSEGFYGDVAWGASGSEYWVNNFWPHFLGVSAIVWVILLVVVSIGIYIPARSLSKVTPVEALRDE